MKNIARDHTANLNEETWVLKFKDKPNRSAFRIDLNKFMPTQIEIIKIPHENNNFILKLKK